MSINWLRKLHKKIPQLLCLQNTKSCVQMTLTGKVLKLFLPNYFPEYSLSAQMSYWGHEECPGDNTCAVDNWLY